MIVKGKFEIELAEEILKQAKELGWTQQQIKSFVQEALNGWVKESIFESLQITLDDENYLRER